MVTRIVLSDIWGLAMRERILITGGAGFIGLHLARSLVARGAHVTLIDNFFRGSLDQDLQVLRSNMNLIEHDLTQPLPEQVVVGDYTQVYHLAAVVGVRYSNDMPHIVMRTNLLATLNLLDWCREGKHLTLCFASTSEAYAGSVTLNYAPIPTPEDVPLTLPDLNIPRASYAASKIVGEQLCLNYARAFGFSLRIVRYHNIYGPRMGYEHVIPQFIRRLLERQNPFHLYGAWQSRAFCYVDDAVEATLQLMDLPGVEPLTVNIGNDREEIQIVDLAHKLFPIVGFSPELSIYPPPLGSPERRCPDLERLRHLTDYEPKVALERGLWQTFEWYKRDWERQGDTAGKYK